MITAAKINDIKEYTISGSELMIVNLNKQLFLGERLISSDSSMVGSLLNRALIYSQKSDLKTRIINLDNNEIKVVGLLSFRKKSFDGKSLIGSEYFLPDFRESIIKFDFDSQKIAKTLFDIPHYKVIWANQSLLVIKNNESFDATSFFLYNHQTETTLWQFDSSELGIDKISKIMGVFGEVLVVVGDYTKPRLEYRDHYEKILGLDIKTGELLYEISEYEVNGVQHLLQGLWNNLVFNNEETELYALAGNHFFCLDSQLGILKVNALNEIADESEINGMMSSSIQGQKLAFRAFTNHWEGFPNTIGIFNIKNQKIEWLNVFDEFREQGGSVKNTQPKISGNKIYSLDTNNTFHIFERESSKP